MSDKTPVQPVEAATVILVRESSDASQGWECFMVRRHVRSDFAADVFVFPGGKVDPADRDPGLLEVLSTDDGVQNDDAGGTAWFRLRVAALRELFEEAGVILAREMVPVGDTELLTASRELARGNLQSGRLTMLQVAREFGWCLDITQLHHFSRWITPDTLPRRYDTHFFVARLPADQEPLHDAIETTASLWISPVDALQRAERGDFPLVFATEKHLERMARYSAIDELIAATTPADLEAVMPRIIERDGATAFLLPGDEGY